MWATTSPALVLPALRRRRFVAFAFNKSSSGSLSRNGILQESFLDADVVTRVSGNRGREGSRTLASRRSAAFERHILHPTKAARESILQFYPVSRSTCPVCVCVMQCVRSVCVASILSHSTCPVCVRVMHCVRSVCCVYVWVCPHELVRACIIGTYASAFVSTYTWLGSSLIWPRDLSCVLKTI